MTSLRSQAAPLPGAPTNLTRAALAFADGDPATGRRLFDAAFLDISPLVRMVVARHLDGPEDRDDAFQTAMSSIWDAVQRGIDPAIELRARGAAIDRWRRETRHDDHRHVSDRYGDATAGSFTIRQENRDDPGAQFERFVADDPTDATVDQLAVDDLAAAAGAERPIWHAIVHLLAAGLTQAETARALDRPAGTVTRNVVELRQWIETRAA